MRIANILILIFIFSTSSLMAETNENQYKSVTKELNQLTSKSNLSPAEETRLIELQNMQIELGSRIRQSKSSEDGAIAKLPLTVETPMMTVPHPNYQLHKLINDLHSNIDKLSKTDPIKNNQEDEREAIRKIAIEYANTCAQMGCYCGQGNVPPSCYQDPNRCCLGEAPKQKTDLEKISEKLKGCNRYDGAISCSDGTYVKKSEDPNTIFKIMDRVNDNGQIIIKKPQDSNGGSLPSGSSGADK